MVTYVVQHHRGHLRGGVDFSYRRLLGLSAWDASGRLDCCRTSDATLQRADQLLRKWLIYVCSICWFAIFFFRLDVCFHFVMRVSLVSYFLVQSPDWGWYTKGEDVYPFRLFVRTLGCLRLTRLRNRMMTVSWVFKAVFSNFFLGSKFIPSNDVLFISAAATIIPHTVSCIFRRWRRIFTISSRRIFLLFVLHDAAVFLWYTWHLRHDRVFFSS